MAYGRKYRKSRKHSFRGRKFARRSRYHRKYRSRFSRRRATHKYTSRNQYQRIVLKTYTVYNASTKQSWGGTPIQSLSVELQPNLNAIDPQEWSNQMKEVIRFNNARLRKITTVIRINSPWVTLCNNDGKDDETATTKQFDMEMLTKNIKVHFGRSDLNAQGITGDWWLNKNIVHTKPGKGFVYRAYVKKGLGQNSKDWHFIHFLFGDGSTIPGPPPSINNNAFLNRQIRFDNSGDSETIARNYATKFQVGVTGWPDYPHNMFMETDTVTNHATHVIGCQIELKQYYHFTVKELKP